MSNFTTNPKVLESRERKALRKADALQKKQLQQEQIYWMESDKNVLAQQERKKEKKQKEDSDRARKLENRKLYDAEHASLKSDPLLQGERKPLPNKVIIKEQQDNLMNFLENKLEDLQISEEENQSDSNEYSEEVLQTEDDNSFKDKDVFVVSNTNYLNDPTEYYGGVKKVVRPEKKAKAAWIRYKDFNYSLVQSKNPDLNGSQISEILRKQWKVASENPFNNTYN